MLVPFCLLIIPVWQILKLEIVKFDCIRTYIRTSSGKKLCEIAKSWKLWVYRDSDCVQARAWNRLKIDCSHSTVKITLLVERVMHRVSIFNCRCRFEMTKIFRTTEEIYFYLHSKSRPTFWRFFFLNPKKRKKYRNISASMIIKNRLLPCTRSLFPGDSEINFNALVIYFRQT